MTTSTQTIIHNGTAYDAVPGTIARTRLGFHPHHLRTVAELGISLPGNGFANTGDYVLDQAVDGGGSKGTAYGLDYILHILRAANASSWEELNGCELLVLFADADAWGRQALGLARTDGSHVFVFAEHSKHWNG